MAEWFKEWFASEDYLGVYNHRDENEALQIINTILSKVEIAEKSLVLDAACGAGRHSFILNDRGFKVVSFDLSKTLLEIAQKQNENREVLIFNADIREVQFKTGFSAVFNLFTSFGYFENDKQNFIFPRLAYDVIIPGGYYILDYFNALHVKRNLKPHSKKISDGKVINEFRRINSGRVEKEIRISSRSGVKTYHESVKLYEANEIIDHFKRIGFQPVELLGGYDGAKFNPDNSERFIAIFQK